MKKKKLNSGHTVIQAFFCLLLMQRSVAIYRILRYGDMAIKKSDDRMWWERRGMMCSTMPLVGRKLWTSAARTGPLNVGHVLYHRLFSLANHVKNSTTTTAGHSVGKWKRVSYADRDFRVPRRLLGDEMEGDQWDLFSAVIPYHTHLVVPLYNRRGWLLKCCTRLLYQDIVWVMSF